MQLSSEEKNYAMWCHLSALCALVGVPFGHFVGPFIVWQMKKDQSAFVDENGKESLNFQISFFLYSIAACIALGLCFVLLLGGMAGTAAALDHKHPSSPGVAGALMAILLSGGVIGPLCVLFAIPFLGLVLTIIAGVKAGSGEMFRYPLIIRFFR